MDQIYETLNDAQQRAVFHTDGPLLILAGAGSGKTKVLTHRIAYLIEEKHVEPYHIMAITFTNKAAGEMRNRVNKIVGFGAEQVWVSTFHSACVRILRRYIDQIGYEQDFAIYDTDDQKRLIRDVVKRLNLDSKQYRESGVLAKISDFKNKLMTTSDVERMANHDFRMTHISKIYDAYQEAMKKNNALDFDDLIMLTVKLLKMCPEILENYQERLRYIMVDEYQDTNAAQFAFVNLLACKYQNLCVVGDDDQSIYKFRGADISNILEFEKHFPNARVIKLEQNYRSTKNILAAANAVIHHNYGRKDKTLWSDNDEGEKIRIYQADDGFEEADMVAGKIQEQVNGGKAVYSDFAVLYRTNAQSRALEEKLLMKNIPYKIIGGQNFYQRREIKDVLAYLRVVANATDDIAVERIINVPKRGIGVTSINRAKDYAMQKGINLYDAFLEADFIPGLSRVCAKIKTFTDLIESHKERAEGLSLRELTNKILAETGYMEELVTENTDEAEGRIENINELLSKIAEYEDHTQNPSLSEFLEEVALVSDIDSLNGEHGYVVLMTVHSAKGLEFPNVFLCGMEDGLFPGYISIMSDDDEAIEEERRLCYVAITRAMNHLTISYAKRRRIRGETQYNVVSRFVKEIPGTIVHTEHLEKPVMMQYEQKKTFHKTHFTKPAFGKSFSVSKAEIDYGIGDRVHHMKFGDGTVLEIEDGARDYQVTVHFDRVGKKMMMASFAKLKKCSQTES